MAYDLKILLKKKRISYLYKGKTHCFYTKTTFMGSFQYTPVDTKMTFMGPSGLVFVSRCIPFPLLVANLLYTC